MQCTKLELLENQAVDQEEREYGRLLRRNLTQNDDSGESTDDSESFVEEPPVEEPPVEEPPVVKYQLRKPHVSKVRDYNYPLNLMLRRYIRSLQIFC